MQIHEATMNDFGHVIVLCDASDRTLRTGEMIAPTIDRVVLVAVAHGEFSCVATTHLHRIPTATLLRDTFSEAS